MLAFAPSRWAAASAAPRRPAGMQGCDSAGPPAPIPAAAQEAAEAARNGSLQDGDGLPAQEAGRGSMEQPEQPAAEPEQEGGQAPIAANGSPTLEPILRALEMLGMQSQQVQQQQQQAAAAPQQEEAQQELPLPLLPPRLAREHGGRTRHSARSSDGPAVGSLPPGVATVTTGPFASAGWAGGTANGLLTPTAAQPAVLSFATPAALSGMQVVPSPTEPSPMALLAALSAAPDAAAAAKRRRRKQQQQQQQRTAAASGRPPKPSRSRQTKRREDQRDGREDQQQPAKRQRSRKAAAAAAAPASEAEQQPAQRRATPSALPSDPRLPLYETSSAQGAFHYIFGRSLLFELPPPAPPLGE